MSLRTLLVLGLTGCAAGFTTVPETEWQTVPARERATIDGAAQTEVARLQAELASATLAVTEARRALAIRPAAHTIAPAAAPGDDWADAVRAHERDLVTARTQIDAATTAWLSARLAWHQHRVELVTAQLAVARCEHQLVRARAVDHHLLGTDTYDTAPFRGQIADAQTRWYAAETSTGEARVALDRASSNLAASKERYATLVRGGPTAPTSNAFAALPPWNPTAARDRGHRLHFGHVVADRASYLTPPRN